MPITSVLLPDVVEWVKASYQQNRSPFDRSLLVKDFAHTATANPITITPFGSQKIDGASTWVITTDGGSALFYPLEDLSGWFAVNGGVGTTIFDTSAIMFIIDGSGSAISTGIAGDVGVPWNCTITSATLLADKTGSIVVDVWNAPYASYPPTAANTITSGAIPTITTATHSQDNTLTGWMTSLLAGSTIRFNVNSATTITRCTVWLQVTKV